MVQPNAIVTKLRDGADRTRALSTRRLCTEAADEIGRLRFLLAEAAGVLGPFGQDMKDLDWPEAPDDLLIETTTETYDGQYGFADSLTLGHFRAASALSLKIKAEIDPKDGEGGENG